MGRPIRRESRTKRRRIGCAAPRIRHLYLGLYRAAQGSDERAPRSAQPPPLDARGLWTRTARRGVAEDALQFRCLGVGVLLASALWRPAGDGQTRRAEGPC